MERAKGIEPSCPAWEAGVLPLNYARNTLTLYQSRLVNSILNMAFAVVNIFSESMQT